MLNNSIWEVINLPPPPLRIYGATKKTITNYTCWKIPNDPANQWNNQHTNTLGLEEHWITDCGLLSEWCPCLISLNTARTEIFRGNLLTMSGNYNWSIGRSFSHRPILRQFYNHRYVHVTQERKLSPFLDLYFLLAISLLAFYICWKIYNTEVSGVPSASAHPLWWKSDEHWIKMRNLFPCVPSVSLRQFSVSPPVVITVTTNEKLFNRRIRASKAIFNPSTPTQQNQQQHQKELDKHLQLQQSSSSYCILVPSSPSLRRGIEQTSSLHLLGLSDLCWLQNQQQQQQEQHNTYV